MPTVRGVRVRPDLLYLASGWSALVTDVRGRITGADPQGFYARNTRVLRAERLTIDGREPVPFSTATVQGHAQVSYAELGDGEPLSSRAAYLTVERFVGAGLRTRLTVTSYADAPLTLRLGIGLTADFADTAEAETGHRVQHGEVGTVWDADRRELRLTYLRNDLNRAVAVRLVTDVPVRYAAGAVDCDLRLAPGGRGQVEILVEPVFDGERLPAPPATFADRDTAARADGADSRAAAARARLAGEFARLSSSNVDVTAAWRCAVDDLAVLPLGEPAGPAAPMAGLPLYQEIFGRDTMTASWQALLAGPTPLADSLRLIAEHVGRRVDDWHDEEPGKPLHEARQGPLSVLGIDPFRAYYGDWSTGPDFLVFLGQYYAWTGDRDLLRELLPTARRVLDWLDRYADLDGDGFLEYHRRSRAGLKNQGWKDSDTAIVDEYGQVVANPIASSELQGYWYAALRHAAGVFAATGHPGVAARLHTRAARLARRFHDAYWLPELGCYAMALGPDGRPVRSVNSNDGHLLATGIVPPRHARSVADRLLAPDMFSGWGVRTLSAAHPAYNPFSYHRGSVWPVEAGTIGLGLARYGCWEHLHRLAEGMFAAAALFAEHRLPEALGGLPRDAEHPHPGIYPNSCSPQAWSASAVVALVHALLALRPVASLRTLLVDPHLPEWLPDLALEGVRVGDRTVDLTVRRRSDGRTTVRATGDRIAVIRRPTRRAAATGRRRGRS
ncbi:glycogen debranching N-terminal domain-containing protein [Micromonospora krabiensis]|uniref:Glycogen debranching enzyme (Alpha-1,6-glucosidase) n=1 Tax=Micromonospora krabiensis TaxID=307121 RepID=A0A1C3MYJ4_9ACTN|nr:glycogen debranching N-terminal domain-containing protein [Micromonospora krabiensis]SBV25389.1 Glycogen debranching enzyme (alpha-1,6-glucosidase) [Micromonospora krabiensis]